MGDKTRSLCSTQKHYSKCTDTVFLWLFFLLSCGRGMVTKKVDLKWFVLDLTNSDCWSILIASVELKCIFAQNKDCTFCLLVIITAQGREFWDTMQVAHNARWYSVMVTEHRLLRSFNALLHLGSLHGVQQPYNSKDNWWMINLLPIIQHDST